MSAIPPFFIVGSARSGTTLLRVMLNAHPLVAVPPESWFITQLWAGRDEVEIAPLLERLAAHQSFQKWDLPIEAVRQELPPGPAARYADVIAAAFRAYARTHGKSAWGDKTPRYVESIALLDRIFPEARFVHLIRDGRNVALSYADVPFGPKTVAKAAALWGRRVSAGMETGRRLGAQRYLEVRYEDLVTDPQGVARNLCDFLGIGYDASMLEYSERARDAVLPKAARYNPHVTERPIATTRSWKQDMPRGQIEVFEAIAGPVLERAGYERAYPQPSLKARLAALAGRAGLPVGRLPARRR